MIWKLRVVIIFFEEFLAAIYKKRYRQIYPKRLRKPCRSRAKGHSKVPRAYVKISPEVIGDQDIAGKVVEAWVSKKIQKEELFPDEDLQNLIYGMAYEAGRWLHGELIVRKKDERLYRIKGGDISPL